VNPPELLPGPSYTLDAGTRLFRVHKRYRRPDAFNTSQAWANERDGRFDSDSDDYYPFYYAALSERGALYETLVAEACLTADEPISRASLQGRVLSTVELVEAVTLLSLLSEEDFAQVGQREWLVRARPHEYPLTRSQARSLRSVYAWAQGLIWYSRKNPDEESVVLFGDRCDLSALLRIETSSVALDAPQAESWLTRLLQPHRLERV
jgi:hypothetical protein